MQVVREADALRLEALLEHHDGRRVVLALRVPGAGHEVVEIRELARLARRGAGASVAVEDEDARLRAQQLRQPDRRLLGDDGRRGVLLRGRERRRRCMPLHRVRERLREQEEAGAEQQDELDRGDEARDERRGPPGADQCVGCGERRIHGCSISLRRACSFIQAQVRREAVVERDLRAPAELALDQRDVEHRALHVAEPRRLEPRRRVDARDLRARGVQLRDRRVLAGADVVRAAGLPDGREQRVDDVVDVDEVAALGAVAEDHRLLAAREPLEEDRDDAALEPRVLPRPVDVREAQRHVRGAVDAVPAGEVLLAALLRDAVGRERQERRVLARRLGHSPYPAPPDDAKITCAPGAACSTLTVPTTFTAASYSGRFIDVCTSACAARWKTTSASTSNGTRMSCSSRAAAGFRFSRLPEAKLSTTTTSSPRAIRASTRFDPMKPAPPVTTARIEAVD